MDEILNYPHFKIAETEYEDDEFYRTFDIYIVRWSDINQQVKHSGIHITRRSAIEWIKKNHEKALSERFEKKVLCGELE